MIVPPIGCVLDASVGIKHVIAEPDSALAHALFAHLLNDPAARFHVPDFFFLECTNILWKLLKKGSLTLVEAQAAQATLKALPFQSVDVIDLIETALDIAAAHHVSAYDAAYVAASARMNVPLITADDKLVRKLAGTPYQIELLGGLTIPSLPPTAAGS